MSGSIKPEKAPTATEFAAEAKNLDFNELFAAPVMAAFGAQQHAATESIRFIEQYCIEGDELKTAKMKYININEKGKEVPIEVNIPLITMLPIPYFQIESMSINFNMKVNQTISTSEQKTEEVAAGVSIEAGQGQTTVSISGGFAMKKSMSKSNESSKDYTMAISLNLATSDMMESPAWGTIRERLFEAIWEDAKGEYSEKAPDEQQG
mmetsp:Transcript_33006/g.82980  ORF Transcript_33006/g.82980 Transcript_33006/m.82980 type:complete len:208 (+) Transcript_33006:494-1117(+)|eukprot:CAMPEP_0177656262 /NCGR_PEP_ID=MMETSP0447-20121125/15454_1 /TAXON_ID=0 /ORGANISM="Stygamoeba regulata, Strain BSH-02190019" /LENGTH=207 /DNA_ID=CAMNT_0019160331 /DNA_START=433 /DNA_END=1056 /DNA_ORIENTATION=+